MNASVALFKCRRMTTNRLRAIFHRSACVSLLLTLAGPALAEDYEADEVDDKYGFTDSKGREVIPHVYEDAADFSEGLAAVSINGKWGYINETGKQVIPATFDKVGQFKDGVAYVAVGKLFGFVDTKGKLVIAPKYADFNRLNAGLIAVQDAASEKWAILSPSGTVIQPAAYGAVYPFEGKDSARVVRAKGAVGIIDAAGKEIVPPKYDNAAPFSEGLAAVVRDKKWGFVDRTGKVVIPLKYESCLGSFASGLHAVKVGEKWGYIDTKGNIAIQAIYDTVWPFSGDTAPAKLDGSWGVIGKDGKEILPFEYSKPSTFIEGIIKLMDSESRYCLFKDGKVLLACDYDEIGKLSETEPRVAIVKQSHAAKGLINQQGKPICNAAYDSIEEYKNGLAKLTWHGKKGFASATGVVIGAEYDYASSPTADGYVTVGTFGPDKIGVLDRTGKQIVPFKYKQVDDFSEGLVAVTADMKKWGFVDTSGKEVIPLNFERGPQTPKFVDGRAQVKSGNRIHFIDKSGKDIGEVDEVTRQATEAKAAKEAAWLAERKGELKAVSDAQAAEFKEQNKVELKPLDSSATVVIEGGYPVIKKGGSVARKYPFGSARFAYLSPTRTEIVITYESGLVDVYDVNGNQVRQVEGASRKNPVKSATWAGAGDNITLTFQDGKVSTRTAWRTGGNY